MYSKYFSNSCLLAMLLATYGCGTTVKYPHKEIIMNQKLGIYAQLVDPETGVAFANSLLDKGKPDDLQEINKSLEAMAVHKQVLKAVMQTFPARTNAKVLPILSDQAKFQGSTRNKFDPIATGRSLSLNYVMVLNVVSQLITTGHVYQEQWRPSLKVTAVLVKIKDGQKVIIDSLNLSEKPFLKYLNAKEESEVLQQSYSKLATKLAKIFSRNIGPVIRTIPEKEKMIHDKIYAFGHIRKLANKNNCVISGDLRKETTNTSVLYHVPCRDIVLTYACDSESDKSRCWLQ